MTNPAKDRSEPYFELVEDTRRRWSWVLWDRDDKPVGLSAVTFANRCEAAEDIQRLRSFAPDCPIIFYTNRREKKPGQYHRWSIDRLRREDGM